MSLQFFLISGLHQSLACFEGAEIQAFSTMDQNDVSCQLLFWFHFWQLRRDEIDEQWLDHSLFFYVVPGEGNHRIIHFKQRGFPLKFGPFHVRDEVQTTSQIWEGVQGDG